MITRAPDDILLKWQKGGVWVLARVFLAEEDQAGYDSWWVGESLDEAPDGLHVVFMPIGVTSSDADIELERYRSRRGGTS